jgi:hypothetical protein
MIFGEVLGFRQRRPGEMMLSGAVIGTLQSGPYLPVVWATAAQAEG